MNERTVQLDIPLLLPDIEDVQDACIARLEESLQNRRGIRRVHVKADTDSPQLCLHFDPNLLALAAVRRLALAAGSDFTDRYRHEQMPFAGLDAADAALTLQAALNALPGMLHASVSYAAGLAYVAYNGERLDRTTIARTLRSWGARIVGPVRSQSGRVIAPAPAPEELAAAARTGVATEEAEPDHGAVPAFLPRWMQERWTLILVGLAQDNTLSRVMQMVAEAQSQQSPTQQFTQRFTARFVPAVLVFVALVIVVPPQLGWMTLPASFYRAMLLLIAASPCALALGTPASVLAGIAQAARNGVLIKGGVHLENLGSLNVMAFDKTGTLTEGKFKVTDIVPLTERIPTSCYASPAPWSSNPITPWRWRWCGRCRRKGWLCPRRTVWRMWPAAA
ncbi:MAG TPA: HAD-IC family P-type ATPase [Anaerolineae bacterium]